MFSPLLIKISFATLGSIGVAIGGYFLYKKTSSKKVTGETVSSVSPVVENGVPSVIPKAYDR